MAEANRSGACRTEYEDPDRTQRIPDMQRLLDDWFPADTTTEQCPGGDH